MRKRWDEDHDDFEKVLSPTMEASESFVAFPFICLPVSHESRNERQKQ